MADEEKEVTGSGSLISSGTRLKTGKVYFALVCVYLRHTWSSAGRSSRCSVMGSRIGEWRPLSTDRAPL